ncbi:uncharacterized protein PSFLO_01006 [Pseudozyma flocculosa]|uniref:Uncharacterized protein n=1 Tax=Pseudozyma flocculosa TaxID=84751 RepID=A0A5C3EUY3_9BASI|nr:uncharacterized protein PSFLO_01006 [Pseudozyma flocculosa]
MDLDKRRRRLTPSLVLPSREPTAHASPAAARGAMLEEAQAMLAPLPPGLPASPCDGTTAVAAASGLPGDSRRRHLTAISKVDRASRRRRSASHTSGSTSVALTVPFQGVDRSARGASGPFLARPDLPRGSKAEPHDITGRAASCPGGRAEGRRLLRAAKMEASNLPACRVHPDRDGSITASSCQLWSRLRLGDGDEAGEDGRPAVPAASATVSGDAGDLAPATLKEKAGIPAS